MGHEVRGARQRPRVAVVGEWKPAERRDLQAMFPGIVHANSLVGLGKEVSPAETDLVVIGDRSAGSDRLAFMNPNGPFSECHLILFGPQGYGGGSAPGPRQATTARIEPRQSARARSNEYVLATREGVLADVVRRTFEGVDSMRDAPTITLYSGDGVMDRKAGPWSDEAVFGRAVDPPLPFAVSYWRVGLDRGLFWLTVSPKNRVDWVRAIVFEWAQHDRPSFEAIVPWSDRPEWMTAAERTLRGGVAAATKELDEVTASLRGRISALESELLRERARADQGARALLTAQDKALVDAVASAFRDLGFTVEDMDAASGPNEALHEDLRLKVGDDASWEAIVEVKGHAKRGANMQDLMKIGRHVNAYVRQKQRTPSVRIYVVNGQFALPPDLRRRPFETARGDVEDFAEQDGLVIPTIDLFRLHREVGIVGAQAARALLMGARGVFAYPP